MSFLQSLKPHRRHSVTAGGFKTATLTWRIENFLARLDFAEATGERTLRSDPICLYVLNEKQEEFDFFSDWEEVPVGFELEIGWNPRSAANNRGQVGNETICCFC